MPSKADRGNSLVMHDSNRPSSNGTISEILYRSEFQVFLPRNESLPTHAKVWVESTGFNGTTIIRAVPINQKARP